MPAYPLVVKYEIFTPASPDVEVEESFTRA